jgi:hypothetical protein
MAVLPLPVEFITVLRVRRMVETQVWDQLQQPAAVLVAVGIIVMD